MSRGFRQNGDLAGALRLLLGLIADIQDDAEGKRLLVHVINACGEVAEAMGDLAQARGHYSRLADICYDAGDYCACDYAQLRLARVLTNAGQFEEAEQQIDGLTCQPEPAARIDFTAEGMERWEKRLVWAGQPEPRRRQLILLAWLEIGRCRAMRGRRYADAIAALQRALHHCELNRALSLDEKPLAILELASAYFESGELRRARDELAKLPGAHADPAVLVLPLETGSRIDVFEGVPGQAVRKLEKAVLICAEAERGAAANTEQLNLAALLISLNQFTRAEEYLATIPPEALAEADRARREALVRLSDLRAGTVSRGSASAESSTEMWKAWKAPERHESSGTPFTYPALAQAGFLAGFEARVLGFYALLGDDNLEGAADELARMGRDFGATDSRLGAGARLGYLTGLVAYYGGDLETACTQLEASVHAFDDMGDLFDCWQALRALGWARGGSAGQEDEAARSRERSDEILERIADSLGPVEGAIFLLNKWTVVEEHLSRELRRVVKAQKELDQSPRLTAFFRRRGVFQRIDSAMRYIDAHRLLISRAHGLGGEAARISAASSAEIARETSESPVLRFVVLPDRLVCILVHGSDARILESEVNRAGIRSLVAGFHENIRNFTDKPAKLAEAERKLAQISKAILLTELTGNLPAGTELRLLPDDCLHGIPFAALPLEGGALLGDRFPVSIGSDWQTGERAQDEHPPRTALLLGLSYQDVDDAEPLDGTEEELRGVLATEAVCRYRSANPSPGTPSALRNCCGDVARLRLRPHSLSRYLRA